MNGFSTSHSNHEKPFGGSWRLSHGTGASADLEGNGSWSLSFDGSRKPGVQLQRGGPRLMGATSATQRRGDRPLSGPSRRRLASMAVTASLVALAGCTGLRTGPSASDAATAPTSSPSPSPSPTPGATWQVTPATTFSTFTSTAYSYTIGYPSNWKTHQSLGQLGPTDYPYDFSGGVDYLSATSPDVLDPGLIIAAPQLKSPTDLAGWMANIAAEQGTTGCAAPDATDAATVAGLPAQIDTWNHCPYVLWAGFVRGGRAYHVILIDQFAQDNPPLEAADKAMFLRMLGTFALTGPEPTFGPSAAPTSAIPTTAAPSAVSTP